MTIGQLNKILKKLQGSHIGVVGDFCLDDYWEMDYTASEISIETGLSTRPVRSQRYTPGGAGNVVNNLAAIGIGHVEAFGVVGNDPFGAELLQILSKLADTAAMVTQESACTTPVYIKPVRNGEEEGRIDFGDYNVLAEETAHTLMSHLAARLPHLDALIVNQQLSSGIHVPQFRGALQRLIEVSPLRTIVVDARDCPDAYTHCIHKLNDREALRLLGENESERDEITEAHVIAAGTKLYERWGRPLFVTRGGHGCVVIDESGEHTRAAVPVRGPVDTVGAGDSFLSGVTAALATGEDNVTAAELGTLAAGVTVQKLLVTGTATPTELRETLRGDRE